MGNLIQAAKDKPVLSTIAATAVSITAVLGGAKALNIDLIPWATADEINALSKKIDDRDDQIMKLIQALAANQKSMESSQSALLREFWEKRLEEANEELKINPNSRTAKAQRAEAQRNIEMIDLSLSGVPPRSTLPSDDQ